MAEGIATLWLMFKGYRILERRYRSHAGEIDLIVKKGNTLIACEVKLRATKDKALLCLTTPQKTRIMKALIFYVGTRPHLAQDDLRLDFFLLTPTRMCHIKGAWDTMLGDRLS
ncbi:MAG: YraN family protein [Alphaproteobacteria bacterium]|nr:YraN family protein [Alphaproteobacteria bacterium]